MIRFSFKIQENPFPCILLHPFSPLADILYDNTSLGLEQTDGIRSIIDKTDTKSTNRYLPLPCGLLAMMGNEI